MQDNTRRREATVVEAIRAPYRADRVADRPPLKRETNRPPAHGRRGDEELEPFDYAITLAPHAERVLICVRKPTVELTSEARRRRIQIIRLCEPSQAAKD